MNVSDIISFISLGISLVSLIISIILYFTSAKHQKKVDTINAYHQLQTDVLDKFALCDKKDVKIWLEHRDNKDVKNAYNDCRALMAKIEHFAVGVNNSVYDYKTMKKLSGVHLIYVYEKLEPIIKETRKYCKPNEKPYYSEFENMVNKLKQEQS